MERGKLDIQRLERKIRGEKGSGEVFERKSLRVKKEKLKIVAL